MHDERIKERAFFRLEYFQDRIRSERIGGEAVYGLCRERDHVAIGQRGDRGIDCGGEGGRRMSVEQLRIH
jgi:hypothetical protein